MTLSHHVAVITSDEQALIVASDLAEDFRRDSILRDRERRLPLPELDVFSRSGLWGISVPKAYGGAGVSNATLAEFNLDRHWRNARVHTLHDPVRWKYHAIGAYRLNGTLPARHSWI